MLIQLRNERLLRTGRNRLIFDPDVLDAVLRYSSSNSTSLS
jgi:hypothetical protein